MLSNHFTAINMPIFKQTLLPLREVAEESGCFVPGGWREVWDEGATPRGHFKGVLAAQLRGTWSVGPSITSFKMMNGEFPDGSVVKTPRFQCRGCRLNSWSEN